MRFRALALTLWLASTALSADPDSTDILLVGNSFTFYNNGIHTHLRNMLKEAETEEEPQFRIRSLTLSGARLQEHEAALQSALAFDEWDRVVLQGHSLEAFDESRVPGFLEAAEGLSNMVTNAGGQPLFFMTWAYDGRPEMLKAIEANYRKAATRADAAVIPVGLAFARAIAQIEDVQLYHSDGKHPSLEGTYLAACTFYAVLREQSATPLDYTAGLTPELSDDLCNVAWQTVETQQGKN